MIISEKGKQLIKAFEGLALEAYRDGAGWSIGYGMQYYADGCRVQESDRISIERAEEEFNYIVNRFSENVNALIHTQLTQCQFDALVSLLIM